ncbi:MAG TPA: hypothetical protein VFY93_19040 [Planctomycetota bacterium]|nr:hypothetical protein [Planctomycetota bacterium]
MRRLLPLLLLLSRLAGADSLDDALARAGFDRAHLGWAPKGSWHRFPRAVTWKLDHFDALFAEPLAVVPFTRGLGRGVREYLGADAPVDEYGAGGIYKLAHVVGFNLKHGGIRPYSPNLTAEATPLDLAILEIYRAAGRQTRFVTFGKDSPYPLVAKGLREAAGRLPPDVSSALGRLVLAVVDARRWAALAFRRADPEALAEARGRLDLGAESVDALEYPAAVEDVALAWDEASLWYAAGKCLEALDDARRALGPALDASFDWETPWGWIRVRGKGDDAIDARDALLIVDLGGNDTYVGGAGANGAGRLISLCLDLGGDDTYRGERGAQGAGICGIGILMDAAGADRYEAEQYAQGVGQLGFGALVDLAGDDTYVARWSAQGCGYFGVGLLLDAAGKDAYRLHADGQGFGGVGGVGVLADRAGDDSYFAEPDGPKSGRPSYHSDGKVAVSNAQGCAMGRRGDGADGHNWAGGLGALLDAEGNDRYVSGNWSMGTGYWFGTGLLWDGAGDDSYDGYVWSQATGAHFCIGALVDEGGDDAHVARQNNSIAFGHDFAIALLADLGGNDRYETPADGLGFSINRSVAMLVDVGGDDVYRAKGAPGAARFDPRFADRDAIASYWVLASSIGLFLDVGGRDDYGGLARDGTSWGDGEGSENWAVRNVGVGADVAGGSVDWTALPMRGRPAR